VRSLFEGQGLTGRFCSSEIGARLGQGGVWYVDPPRRAERKDLEGDQHQVGVSLVHDDVRVFPSLVHESGAGGVDNADEIIGAILGRCPGNDGDDGWTGVRVPARMPAWHDRIFHDPDVRKSFGLDLHVVDGAFAIQVNLVQHGGMQRIRDDGCGDALRPRAARN